MAEKTMEVPGNLTGRVEVRPGFINIATRPDDSEIIVSMVTYKDDLFMATSRAVYKYIKEKDEFVRLKIEVSNG